MLGDFPKELNDALETEGKESLKRGKITRLTHMLRSALVLAATIGVMIWQQTPAALVIAVTVALSALCVIWAVMSFSASLNIHFDLWGKITAHYLGRTDN